MKNRLFKSSSIIVSSILLASLSSPITHAATNNNVDNRSMDLKLVDTDVRTVIEMVSDATGKNFLIDPRVKGKITLVSNSSLEGESLYDVFLTALNTSGYIAVEHGDVTVIVPNAEGKYRHSFKDFRDANAEEFITQIVQIKNIAAAQLKPILRPLMPKEAYINSYTDTNILVLSDTKKNIQRLLKVIHSMDKPTKEQDEIVELQQASASDMLAVLKESMSKKSISLARVSMDKRSNSIIISGTTAERARLKRLITRLDKPVENDAAHHVVFLEHSTAKDLADVLTKLTGVQSQDPKASATATKSSIIADESTNALIISAELKEYQSLYKVLKQLDVPRKQVMIEAIIAEVSIDTSKKLGVEWKAHSSDSGAGSANTGTLLNAVNQVANDDITQALLTGGFSALISKSNIGVMLNAIKNDANVNILSAPKILTLDNKEAEIIVGETVPFLTGSFTQSSNEGATNPFQTVQREDVGLTLRIKPQISQSGVINLEVFQEISNVKNSTAAVDLTTTKRSIKSNVVIADGHMLALGGLMDDSTNDGVDSVPVVGDIPILGWLFKTQTTETKKRTLMVFIKPTIINTTADGNMVTQQALNDMQHQQQEFEQKSLLVDPDKERYQLPVETNEPLEIMER